MTKSYSFLGYVANGNGIKFGETTNSGSTLRFDHTQTNAPGSTKQAPIPVLRNAISLNRRVTLPGCDECSSVTVPVAVTLSFSGPTANTAAIASALDEIPLLLAQVQARLLSGFLPTTDDLTITLGE